MQVTTYITSTFYRHSCYQVPLKRTVDVREPQTKTLRGDLDLVYHYGQNEIQRQPCPSLSIGDTIVLNNNAYVITGTGFFCLNTGETIN